MTSRASLGWPGSEGAGSRDTGSPGTGSPGTGSQRTGGPSQGAAGPGGPGGLAGAWDTPVWLVVADELPDGIVVADEAGRVTAFNRAAARLTGTDPSDALGRTCSMSCRCTTRTAATGGSAPTRTTVWPPAPGTPSVPCTCTTAPRFSSA